MAGLTGTRMRATLGVLLAPLLLTACGDDPEPKAPKAGQECPTQGTIGDQPVATLRDAVAPYLEPGQTVRIAEKHSDTATVQLLDRGSDVTAAVVTLVRTGDGWVTTSVARC